MTLHRIILPFKAELERIFRGLNIEQLGQLILQEILELLESVELERLIKIQGELEYLIAEPEDLYWLLVEKPYKVFDSLRIISEKCAKAHKAINKLGLEGAITTAKLAAEIRRSRRMAHRWLKQFEHLGVVKLKGRFGLGGQKSYELSSEPKVFDFEIDMSKLVAETKKVLTKKWFEEEFDETIFKFRVTFWPEFQVTKIVER